MRACVCVVWVQDVERDEAVEDVRKLELDKHLASAEEFILKWSTGKHALSGDPILRATVLGGLAEVDLLLGEERRALDQFEVALNLNTRAKK